MSTTAQRPSCRIGAAQWLYLQLARRLRPGWREGQPSELGWCTPHLIDAVALPLHAGGSGPAIDVWLACGAADAAIPRRQLVNGQTVAITVHARNRPTLQFDARACNPGRDPTRDGTISAIVRDRHQHDQYFILSCGHVVAGSARARRGDRIELTVNDQVVGDGALEDWAPVLGDAIPRVGIDAGIVRVGADVFNILPRELLPDGVSNVYRFDQDVVVRADQQKIGKLKTRWSGYVDAPGTERPQDYYLENAVGYRAEPATEPGDSGAAVWTSQGDRLIGIHVGAPVGDERWRSNAILCPIDRIMEWFDIEPVLADGSAYAPIPVQSRNAMPAVVPSGPAPGQAPAAGGAAVSSEDADVVAMTLWGEARGEGEQGMRAVACVIGNRTQRKWQGKIGYAAVCRARWQFSCWNENDPNRVRLEQVRRNPDASYRVAAAIAAQLVRGELPDFTSGATHYYAASMPMRPKWAVGKQPCFRLGNHLFFNNVQ